MNRTVLAVAGVLVLLAGITAVSATFVVHQTKQALVLQFGNPQRVVQNPGLHFKIPFIQDVVFFESRVLNVDPPPLQVILSDQKRIIIDAFARYRITNPLEYYKAVRTEAVFLDRYGRALNAAVREVIGTKLLPDLLSQDRDIVMQQISLLAETQAQRFGAEVVDVRIGRTELPEDVLNNVYDRMRSEREREANLLRAEGEENARRIRAVSDRQRVVIVAEAERQSSVLHGQGDAARNRILGEAYGRDQEFFDFYRTLEAYRETFTGEDATTLLMAPDSDFFRYFGDSTRTGGRVTE